MAYAIGFLLSFVGIGALIVLICIGLAEESKTNSLDYVNSIKCEKRI